MRVGNKDPGCELGYIHVRREEAGFGCRQVMMKHRGAERQTRPSQFTEPRQQRGRPGRLGPVLDRQRSGVKVRAGAGRPHSLSPPLCPPRVFSLKRRAGKKRGNAAD